MPQEISVLNESRMSPVWIVVSGACGIGDPWDSRADGTAFEMQVESGNDCRRHDGTGALYVRNCSADRVRASVLSSDASILR